MALDMGFMACAEDVVDIAPASGTVKSYFTFFCTRVPFLTNVLVLSGPEIRTSVAQCASVDAAAAG